MRIAILGWGSLIWDPRNLKIRGPWHEDGPQLPVEFARKSSDGRLTLVIFPETAEVKTLWAESSYQSLREARENLRIRECTPCIKNIGYSITATSEVQSKFGEPITSAILEWARQKGVDAAIWTDLCSNFKEKTGRDFSVTNAVNYLRRLTGEERAMAQEYIQKAPLQIETPVRQRVREDLNW